MLGGRAGSRQGGWLPLCTYSPRRQLRTIVRSHDRPRTAYKQANAGRGVVVTDDGSRSVPTSQDANSARMHGRPRTAYKQDKSV